jgi:ribonuclease I
MAFDHYTFAAMWLPGICQAWTDVGTVCEKERNNPRVNTPFTLHGLWPSRPKRLIEANIDASTWWHYGCYWFDADQKIPKSADLPVLELPAELRVRLNEVMPLTQTHLDRHEYTKHISCFGPSPTQYFSAATQMIDALNTSEFAQWMNAHRGQTVSRTAIQTAFKQGFKQRDASAMQLRCASRPNSNIKNVLTEIWFTIPTEQLAQFPKPRSFGSGLRGNCSAKIQIYQE